MKDEMTVRIVYYDLALSDVDIVNTVVGDGILLSSPVVPSFRFSSRLSPYQVAHHPFLLWTCHLLKNHMLGSD